MANILVVDDEKEIVMLMKIILERAGHKVTSAGNGEIALQVLGVDPADSDAVLPDLVVLDLMMPIVDGFTVAVTMRDEPRTAKLPLLIVTAKTDMRDRFAEVPSVAGFFVKPFNPKQLVETIASVLLGK